MERVTDEENGYFIDFEPDASLLGMDLDPSENESDKSSDGTEQLLPNTQNRLSSPLLRNLSIRPTRSKPRLNQLERERREDIRKAFQILFEQLPPSNKSSSPRIKILLDARSCINDLVEQNEYLKELHYEELQKREHLLKKLDLLTKKKL